MMTNELERWAFGKKTNHMSLTADTLGRHHALHVMVRCTEAMERDGRRECGGHCSSSQSTGYLPWNPLLD